MLLRRLLPTCLLLTAASLLPIDATRAAAASAASAAASVPSAGDGHAWLQRIHDAAGQRNYEGTLVFSAGGAVSSSRIAHYCEGRQSFERIELLDGRRRQVYRAHDVTQTVWPASRIAVLEHRDPLVVFPALLQQDGDERVFERYDWKPEGVDRTAGHDSVVFLLAPRDGERYAQRLWAERGTGLLLRADVLGADGRVLESASFSEVRIGVRPQLDSVLLPMKKLDGLRIVRPELRKTQLAAEGWALPAPVAGFRQLSCVKRPLDAAGGADAEASSQVLQTIFSDGLTHVSVFIEPFDVERHKPVMLSVGATNTLMQRRDDAWVTVMGDVPMPTLKQFFGALQRKP